MKPYTAFSSVYDDVLNHVDYEYWYGYIRSLMLNYIKFPKLILELGCGTGKFGAKFSRDNFLIYGMDKSLDMLQVAKLRAFKNFRIFCGDMTNYYLSKKFDFIFSIHDTINYLTRYDDIRKAFRSVRRIMHHKSIFMFDITTEHNIKTFFDGKLMIYKIRGTEIEWNNKYDESNKLTYSILKFHKENKLITSERHVQRIYSIDEIKRLLKLENLEVVGIFGDYTFSPVKKDTVMINFVTRKSQPN